MPKLGGGLAGEVSAADKEELAQKFREAIATDASVLTKHLLAEEIIVDSLLQETADMEEQAGFLLSRKKKRQDVFDLVVELDEYTKDIDLDDTVMMAHTRYGLVPVTGDTLGEGHPAVVIGVTPDTEGKQVTLTVAMTAGSYANLVMPNGDLLVMPNGDYLTTPPG